MDQKEPEPTCSECVFCRPGDVDPQNVSHRPLFCRRNPPSVVSVPILSDGGGLSFALHTAFPMVQLDTPACGEWDNGQDEDEDEDLDEETQPEQALNS